MRKYIADNQLVVITGPRGVGKTFLAATFLPPDEMSGVYWHDAERSANRVIRNLTDADIEIGRYVNLGSRFRELPDDDDLLSMINKGVLPWVDKGRRSSLVAYYEYILDDLAQNLEGGKYQVYIHDTLEKLEAGMAAWVEANKRKSGVTTTSFGKLWTEGVYPLYEHFIESIFSRGVKTIILTSHLKTPWEGNRPVAGKVAPSGKKILYRLSAFMLWLVNDRRNADGAPAGLVLKERLGKLVPVGNKWEMQRMLPERIPHCTWDDIDKYLERGCDLQNPAEREKLSKNEKDMISELLTDEQMRLMILSEERELEEIKQQSNILTSSGQAFNVPEENANDDTNNDTNSDANKDNIDRVNKLLKEGKNNLEVKKETNLPLPVIIKQRKKIEATS